MPLAGDLAGINRSTSTGATIRAELEHLQDAAGGELRAAQPGRKADEVFDPRRAARLPAGPEPVEHQGRKAFRSGIDGRRDAGRSGADNGEIDFLGGTVSSRCRPRGPAPASEGLTRTRPSLHSMTGMLSGEPSSRRPAGPRSLSGIEPGEGDEVLVKEFADGVRVAAAARADDPQAEHARLGQQSRGGW